MAGSRGQTQPVPKLYAHNFVESWPVSQPCPISSSNLIGKSRKDLSFSSSFCLVTVISGSQVSLDLISILSNCCELFGL